MPVGRSALRASLVLGVAVLGFVLSSAAFLRSGTMLLTAIGMLGTTLALGWLYKTRRPLRLFGVPLAFGVLALLAFYFYGAAAARDIALTVAGVDGEAVVERTWTTRSRGSTHYHCTLRRTDGTPMQRELASSCQGHERGDTIQVVLDPRGRWAPVGGRKSDLAVAGRTYVTAVAGLVLLVSIVIGSVPARAEVSPEDDQVDDL